MGFQLMAQQKNQLWKNWISAAEEWKQNFAGRQWVLQQTLLHGILTVFEMLWESSSAKLELGHNWESIGREYFYWNARQ